MGSLLPPINARALGRALPNTDLARALRTLWVRVDGEDVLRGDLDFKPAPSRAVAVGPSASAPGCPRGFSGEVLSVSRRLP
jgi:hypothetical protein